MLLSTAAIVLTGAYAPGSWMLMLQISDCFAILFGLELTLST